VRGVRSENKSGNPFFGFPLDVFGTSRCQPVRAQVDSSQLVKYTATIVALDSFSNLMVAVCGAGGGLVASSPPHATAPSRSAAAARVVSRLYIMEVILSSGLGTPPPWWRSPPDVPSLRKSGHPFCSPTPNKTAVLILASVAEKKTEVWVAGCRRGRVRRPP